MTDPAKKPRLPGSQYTMTTTRGEHAIVIGASMAGLLAARVLSDHFDRVTLIERDLLPDTPTARNGVPQARHTHILLVRGRRVMDQLLPGLIEDLVADGAVLFDSTFDAIQLVASGWLPRVHSSLLTVSASRDLIEWRVRQRVLSSARINCIQETDVIGLTSEGSQVNGVRIRRRGQTRPEERMPATIVADASGRGSHMPEWLTALEYPEPAVTRVNPFLGYASRIFAQPPDVSVDWKVILIAARPPELKRAGALVPLEGKRWFVTLAGYGRDFPPTHEADFMEFAKSLASPMLYDAIRNAEPLTPIHGYQRTENQMRHYERMDRLPENLVCLGDSVSAFNPVYGQGMTNAAVSAVTLDGVLRQGLPGASRRFQDGLAKQNETPWLLATGEDYRFPTTEGPKPGLATRFGQWYVNRVIATAVNKPEVFLAFNRVVQLVEPPSSLFSPSVMTQVLRQTILRG